MKHIISMAAALLSTAAFTVMAQSVPVESIAITPTSAKLAVGGSRTYSVEILPAEAAAGAKVEWSLSEPRVATITSAGKVRGMVPGVTKVIASCGGKTAELELTVSLKAPKVGNYLFADGTWEQGAVVEGKTCVGMVFYVNPDGRTGKAVSLDEAEQLYWSTSSAAVPAATDALDGAANCAAIAQIAGWESAFQAANWCAQKSNDCLTWYLPAVDEMRQLFAASCGLTWVASGADETKGQVNNWTGNSVTMVYKDGEPDTNPYPEARATFNTNLAKAKGVALAADKYWTSTIMGTDFATFLSFEGGYSNAQPKQYFHVCRTRAITAFPDPEPIVPQPTAITSVTAPASLTLKIVGTEAQIIAPKPVKALTLYTLTGTQLPITTSTGAASAYANATVATFSTAHLPKGLYVVTATLADGTQATAKLLLR